MDHEVINFYKIYCLLIEKIEKIYDFNIDKDLFYNK